MSEQDYFETESGLLTEFTGVVEDAYWAPDPKFGDTRLYLKVGPPLEVSADVEVPPEVQQNGMVQAFGAGKGWVSYDGGVTVEDPNRPGRKKWQEQSGVAKLLGAAVELGIIPTLQARGPAQNAQIWKGLKFRWAEKEFQYGGEIGNRSRAWPVQFLGEVSNPFSSSQAAPAPPPVPPAQPAPVAPAPTTLVAEAPPMPAPGPAPETTADVVQLPSPAAAPAPAAADGNGLLAAIPQPTVDKLRDLAAKAEGDHGKWVDMAMDLTEVQADGTLVMAIADPNQLWRVINNG